MILGIENWHSIIAGVVRVVQFGVITIVVLLVDACRVDFVAVVIDISSESSVVTAVGRYSWLRSGSSRGIAGGVVVVSGLLVMAVDIIRVLWLSVGDMTGCIAVAIMFNILYRVVLIISWNHCIVNDRTSCGN